MIDFHPSTLLCYRCSASTWERVETVEEVVRGRVYREDVIACCFCGVLQRGEATAVPVAAKQHAGTGEFRFQFGRFAGLTLAEADREENGRAYLMHMAATSEKLRGRIEEYLSQNALDRADHDGEIVAPSELSGASECRASHPSSPRLFG